MGYINTALGQINTESLGKVLIHEHIFNRYPTGQSDKSEKFTLTELQKISSAGINTIVDTTPYANISNYMGVINKTNLNVICCVGVYLKKYVPRNVLPMNISQLVHWFSNQIENGLKPSTIRPGIIKLATMWTSKDDLDDFEKRVFSAASIIYKNYQLPIATHSSCSSAGALAQMKFLRKQGVNLRKVLFFHTDKGLTLETRDHLSQMIEILKEGGNLQFSEFGYSANRYPTGMLKTLVHLCEQGYINQIFISTDSYWKWRNGQIVLSGSDKGDIPRTYDYIFRHTIPLLIKEGFSNDDIDKFLRDNPRRFFEAEQTQQYEYSQLNFGF